MLCSSHLVKDQAFTKIGQQLCYLVFFKPQALIYLSFRVHWIYLSAASFLGRIGTHDIFQCGSGSGVCMFTTYSPGWIFVTGLQMRNIRKASQQLLLSEVGIDL